MSTTPLFQSSFALPTVAAPSTTTAPPLCASDLPLVLLPVRLETRFVTTGAATELRIRVYPDKIHLDSHEPDLLAVENEWGRHYWEQDWHAGKDDTARAAAWRQLADRFGPARAAFIARVLRPTNPLARPTTPIPPDQPLTDAIVFPSPPLAPNGEESAWRRAPQARLLPDRWIAVLRSAGATTEVSGGAIARPLAVGPDPKALAAGIADDQLALDAGARWMVDFAEAESKGMAMRVPLTAAMLAAGIDSLLVYGVSTSLDGTTAATQLADLFDAHHFTDGLEFLRYGTSTNNTDARRAAATADDATHARSYAIECLSDPTTLDATSNAARVGTAFGLPTGSIAPVLGRVGQAAERHETGMRSMNTALWQAGWGYYLTNMIGFGTGGLTLPLVAWAREHFVSHVRAGGPFPVLRLGRQPYGILPVTSLDGWKPAAASATTSTTDLWLRDMLVKLRDSVWRPHLPDALRVGRRPSTSTMEVDADLADVMRTDGVSSRYATRAVFGRHYFQHLRAFLGEDLAANGFIPGQDAIAAGLPQRLGIAARPRVARMTGADVTWPITAPLVQSGEVSPWRGLEPNYIADLFNARTIKAIVDARPGAQSPGFAPSLLQSLLRHALLREYASAAAEVAGTTRGESVVATQLRDVELIDLVTNGSPSATTTRLLALPVLPGLSAETIGQYVERLASSTMPFARALGEFRRSLQYLQGLDSETLQYLMQGTLDLSTHRLDAWITSFATKRLAAMRTATPAGAYVGAYAWVENLHPTPTGSAVPVTTLPANEPGPLVTPALDGGFIHAPSATHAAAAALLRNAHLGPTGRPLAGSPFAIDLSSRRVREAERLLDGLRQGQPLGALLGYRFERSLHELGLDAAIAPLRVVAPIAARPLPGGTTPTETIAPNNVVDGLALFRAWQADRAAITTPLQTANVAPADRDLVETELGALGDAIDGLADALTAEAAYQVARGNTSRIAATLAAVSQGDAPPPELEVARMPRSGTGVTHRTMLVVCGTANLGTPGWAAWNGCTRSLAEKALNFWAANLLGDPRRARCTVERIDATTGAVLETRAFPLSDLALCALDAVYTVEPSTGPTRGDDAPSVLEQLVLYRAKTVAGGFDASATLRLQHARPTDLAAGDVTLFDVLEQARAVRRLLIGARGAEPEDLNPPERTGGGAIDLAELEARVLNAENALNAAHKTIVALVPKAADTTADAWRTAILRLGTLGITPAVPTVASGDDAAARDALCAQARTQLKTSGPRMDRMLALRALPVATDERARRDHLVERMHAVFGDTFVVLPYFGCGATGSAELASALAAKTQVVGGDALAPHAWFTRAARVRDPLARLAACVRGADVLGAVGRLNLCVAQLPFVTGDRWVGLPALPGTTVPPGKLSLVLQTAQTINATLPLAGLLVDEWTEIVPNAEENTALTFQHASPDVCAPQNVLVAVPPDPAAPWTSATLARVLTETLDLAKLRAIDPEALGDAAQYLPGLYLAFNAEDHTVSTDFAPLTA